jgi:hypothetical protein
LKKLYQNILLQLLVLFVVVTPIFAQEQIRGRVIDSETNEPIEYVNIIIDGTHIGTVTDENGFFKLNTTETGKGYLNISFIGYETRRIRISDSNDNILLNPDASVLDEVVVVGDNTKENPAHYILKRIRSNHKKNSLKQGDTYSYRKYDRVRFDLYDTDSTLKHLGPFKEFDELKSRKYKKGDNTYVPLLLTEEIYKVYGETLPPRETEVIEASNASGFQNNKSVTMYLKELYLDYDVYDNSIVLFNKKFVSPLSKRALMTYRYAIVDSAMFEGNRIYKIQYFPKRKKELTFEGSFWADTTKYIVHSIDLKATKGFSVNFVKGIHIQQKFKQVKKGLYTIVKDSLAIDFAPFKQFQLIGAEAVKVTTYYDQELDKMTPISFVSSNADIRNKPYLLDDETWKAIRPVGLDNQDADIYTMHKSLAKDRKYILYRKLGEMFTSGWFNYKSIDYGPYYNVIGYNSVEGLRLQMGARTFFSQEDRWRLGGYGAYGFNDKDFKFGLGFSYLLAYKHRWIISLGVKDDLEQRGVLLSQENDVYGRNFAASLFTIGDNSKLTNTVSYRVGLEMEAVKNFRIKVSTKYDYMTSIAGFDMGYLDPITGVEQNSLNDFQVQLSLIYTPNRKEIGNGVDRDFITNWHPTIRLKYIRGIAGFIDSRFNYDKVKFYYRQPFLTGLFGKTIMITELGKTFGTVPLQLMDIIPGNQTISIQQNMFSLMDYYEFVSDTYATLHIDQHFNGRIMNKIPLFNRFDLRATAGFRAMWGEIANPENIAINASEVVYLEPTDGYFEYSAGIENIFKVLRIDAVWRTSYLNNPNSNPFGVRFLLKFVF